MNCVCLRVCVKYRRVKCFWKNLQKLTQILYGRGLTARIRNNILVSLVFAFMRGKQLNNSNNSMKSGSNNNNEGRKNVPMQNELQLQSAREKFIKKRRRQLKMFSAFFLCAEEGERERGGGRGGNT